MEHADRKVVSLVQELAELANHGRKDMGYRFPFTAVVVGADCSIAHLEFVEDDSVPNSLYESSKADKEEPMFLFPINFFFYCTDRAPFMATINGPGEQAVCRSNVPRGPEFLASGSR